MSRPSLREVMDLHWEGTGNDSRMWEHVDVLLSALNIEKSRAEQAEASLAAMTKERDEAQEPMPCGHFGANLQPCDEGPEICIVCVEIAERLAAERATVAELRGAIACQEISPEVVRVLRTAVEESGIDRFRYGNEIPLLAKLKAAEAKVFELEAHYKRVMALPHPAEAKLKVEHDACSEAISQLEASEAKVAQEHENFLAVHRDNMALVLRVAALSKDLARAREALEWIYGATHECALNHGELSCCMVEAGLGSYVEESLASLSAPEAPSESAGKPCVCGDIMQPDIVHRSDGPCYAAGGKEG